MLAELLAPVVCVACGAHVDADLCEPCCGRMAVIGGTRCARCGAPSAVAATACRLCRGIGAFRAARSLVAYGGPASRLTLSLKHRGRPGLARLIGTLLADLAVAEGLAHDAVTFVPAGRRGGSRGFDHAELLARAAASRLRSPLVRVLKRADGRPRQSEAPASRRRANAAGAFVARPVAGSLLLVDDVMTTGATIEACSHALLAAGARNVDAVTWARTLKRQAGRAYTDPVQLILKGRGVELNDRLRDYASTKLTRTQRFFERIIKLEAELSEERNPRVKSHFRCDVTMKTPVQTLRAQGTGTDFFAAIDQAADRLERQVKRIKDRLTSHAHRSENHNVVDIAEPEPSDEPRVVRTRQALVKPMSPEEAILQLDTQGMQFLLFTSAETMEPSVIYRRTDGGYGLIDSRAHKG